MNERGFQSHNAGRPDSCQREKSPPATAMDNKAIAFQE
jgi:hypothetical protein